MKKQLIIGALMLALAAPAFADNTKAPPDASYKKVSTLVSLPDFIPRLGTLYVKPETLPVGPFLAYDRDGKLVSTIYMVPLEDMQNHKNFTGLAVGDSRVEEVDLTFNPGHAGVEKPHYHFRLWHVKSDEAKLK